MNSAERELIRKKLAWLRNRRAEVQRRIRVLRGLGWHACGKAA